MPPSAAALFQTPAGCDSTKDTSWLWLFYADRGETVAGRARFKRLLSIFYDPGVAAKANRIPIALTVVSPFVRCIEFRSSNMPDVEQPRDAVGSLEAGPGQHDYGRFTRRDGTVTQ